MEFELIKTSEQEIKNDSEKNPDFVADEIKKNIENIAPDSNIIEPEKKQLKTKGGQGRHKKDCDCDKCKEKKNSGEVTEKKPTEKKQAETSEQDFNSIINQYESTAPTIVNTQAPTEPQAVVIISGYILLLCLDAVIPALCLKVFKMIDPKGAAKIELKKIKLTADQKKALEPIADQCAKIIFEQMHPVPALALSMGFMYVGNIIVELDNE